MFDVDKEDQPNKREFVIDCCLRNQARCKTQTLLHKINQLIELVHSHLVQSKIDMTDRYFNIIVELSSEQYNTTETPYGNIRSQRMLKRNCNTTETIIEAMLDILKNVLYQCLVI